MMSSFHCIHAYRLISQSYGKGSIRENLDSIYFCLEKWMINPYKSLTVDCTKLIFITIRIYSKMPVKFRPCWMTTVTLLQASKNN